MGTKLECTLDEVVGDMRRVITGAEGRGMIWHVLVGPHGAVQFAYLVHPNELRQALKDLPHYQNEIVKDGQALMGADVGYHAYEEQYNGQGQMECDWLLGGTCFYDGSGLRADDWIREWAMFNFDPEWVWTTLYDYYTTMFLEE